MKTTRTFLVWGVALGGAMLASALAAYAAWSPGAVVVDGRHDRGTNAVWIQHGWMGDDAWFVRNRKRERIPLFRDSRRVRNLAGLLRAHGVTDVFPHLCPCARSGAIPAVDAEQARRFLDEFEGFRVLPWVGGVAGVHAFPDDPAWRERFATSIGDLLAAHPRLAGVHVNIEPCRSGSPGFLATLERIRAVLPPGKILSVAAYPPPTIWHPFPDVHWDGAYLREVARRSDQVAVMMYDTALRLEKVYQHVVAQWTREVVDSSPGSEVLIGVPAYRDQGSGYHDPRVERIANALSGIHAGLLRYEGLPENYRGIALYSEWEMDDAKWAELRNGFSRR